MALRRGIAARARRRSVYQAAREADDGFSLVEMLVVMIIIGILAAIAIPVFLGQRQKSYDAQAKEDIHTAALSEESYFTEQQTYLNVPTATATTLPALLTAEGLRMSSRTIDITVWTYPLGSTTGGSTTTQQSGSFCIKVTSGSNLPFYYSSGGGGMTTTACT